MGSNTQGFQMGMKSAPTALGPVGAAGNEKMELRRVECYLTESLFKRILRRIFPDERRQERHPAPPLVAYLGTASGSRPYELGDISLTGFCLLTDERWMPGTEMPITLQSKNLPVENEHDSFTVQATVVRCGENGVGFSIVLCEEDSKAAYGNPLRVQWVTRVEMENYLKRLKEQPEIEDSTSAGPATVSNLTTGYKTVFEGGR